MEFGETELDDDDSSEDGEEERRVISVETAFDLLTNEIKPLNIPLMTFCKQLDMALCGGFNVNMLTELYGEKGVGKTTFCYQLCLNIQIPEFLEGNAGESVFIDTENSFAIARLKVMARKFASHCRAVSTDCKFTVKSLLNAIHYIPCGDEAVLRATIKGLYKYIAENPKIRLIVIDSLAFPYYVKEGNFEERVQKMYALTQELFQIMNRFNLVVVVTNNLTTRFREDRREYSIPYLGESWAFLPNQRIELTFDGNLRKARIAKCPKGRSNAAYYRVNSAGIRD